MADGGENKRICGKSKEEKKVNRVKFDCEVVTPMFLAGADGHTPELRPPSIKGAMRFWWRAMKGHLSPEELKKKEGEIFGASDEKIGRSKFSVRIVDALINLDEQYKYKPLPHHTGDSNCPYLPSCNSRKNPNKCNKGFKLNAVKPEIRFKLVLSFPDKYLEIDNLIKVAIMLGGLGRRARRGFGSFRILKVNGQAFNFEYNLEYILNFVNDIGNDKYKIENSRIVLKFLKEIQLGKEYNSWENLLGKIGETSHKHNINSLGFAKDKKRLASPIYVSVLKDSKNNIYLPIISTLNTTFENKIEIDEEGQNEFKGAIL